MTCRVSIETGLNKASIWRLWCRHMAAHRTRHLFTLSHESLKFFPLHVTSCSHSQIRAQHSSCRSVTDSDSHVFFYQVSHNERDHR